MLFTPNSEIVQACVEQSSLYDVINSAALIIPDGIGVVYASRILKTPLKQKVAGVELAERLCGALAEQSEKVGLYLLGGKPAQNGSRSVAELAAARLKEKYQGLVIAGTHDGYFSDEAEVIADINASGAKVLFCCLGAPKQELWLYRNRDRLPNIALAAGLGGSIDVFAGTAARAPDFFINHGLEWLWRLYKYPSRLGRMMKLPKFLIGTMVRGNEKS